MSKYNNLQNYYNNNVEFTDNPQMTTEMAPEECLYMNIFSKYLLKRKRE